jgi:copper chaperone
VATASNVYTVPDISCGHCKQAIESEVGQVEGVDSVVVDIDQRTVTVDGTAGEDAIVGAIQEAGYEVAS